MGAGAGASAAWGRFDRAVGGANRSKVQRPWLPRRGMWQERVLRKPGMWPMSEATLSHVRHIIMSVRQIPRLRRHGGQLHWPVWERKQGDGRVRWGVTSENLPNLSARHIYFCFAGMLQQCVTSRLTKSLKIGMETGTSTSAAFWAAPRVTTKWGTSTSLTALASNGATPRKAHPAAATASTATTPVPKRRPASIRRW